VLPPLVLFEKIWYLLCANSQEGATTEKEIGTFLGKLHIQTPLGCVVLDKVMNLIVSNSLDDFSAIVRTNGGCDGNVHSCPLPQLSEQHTN